ncbi:sensor histidine kinase [soil metagenome]
MPIRLSHTQLLRYAGLFTWAVVGIPLVLNTWYFPAGDVDERIPYAPDIVGSTVAYFVFGAAYWLVTRDLGMRRPRKFDTGLLAVLTISAIAVSKLTATGLGSILLMLVSGVIPWLMPVGAGVAWLILQNVPLIPVFEGLGFTPVFAVLQAMMYVGYSSFTFITGLVARQQAAARDEQRRLNSELRATRALLAESSRMSERLRISRELHDLLGHHLTALSLNLEVAGHLAEGKALEHVRQSHTLAKLLLTDVREAVSEMREERGVDLGSALRVLVEGVPALQVHLEMPETLRVDDPERAQVVLRCAQEIITNAVRHAGASHLTLHLSEDGEGLRLQAKDNGRGAKNAAPGNGLRGMRERLSACGGHMDIITAPGEGFALDVHLPLEASP